MCWFICIYILDTKHLKSANKILTKTSKSDYNLQATRPNLKSKNS